MPTTTKTVLPTARYTDLTQISPSVDVPARSTVLHDRPRRNRLSGDVS